MTFLDNAKQEHRISNEDHTIRDLCPSDLGYEAKVKCKAIIGADTKDKAYICRRCWEREMPGTEPKVDGIPVIPQSEVDAYNKGHADGMAQGLADAWKLFKEVLEMPNDVICEHILEGDAFNPPLAMVNCLTPQEALAKLKAYEEAQSKIKVGDIIEIADQRAIVVKEHNERKIYLLFFDGSTGLHSRKDCTKTGKHIDISSILEQIGE